jgi:hypothetical protein
VCKLQCLGSTIYNLIDGADKFDQFLFVGQAGQLGEDPFDMAGVIIAQGRVVVSQLRQEGAISQIGGNTMPATQGLQQAMPVVAGNAIQDSRPAL